MAFSKKSNIDLTYFVEFIINMNDISRKVCNTMTLQLQGELMMQGLQCSHKNVAHSRVQFHGDLS